MFKLVIGREKDEKMFNKRKSKELNSCSICAMNTMNKILKGENISLIKE
ncbi:thiamine biosynthesis protein ThiC [Campylobacter lari]|nr:thiamine biosynthesis protein ThiC [Campylobacter lari]